MPSIDSHLTPEQRTARARKAALARTSVDHHIAALAGKPLTQVQRSNLIALLLVATHADAEHVAQEGAAS